MKYQFIYFFTDIDTKSPNIKFLREHTSWEKAICKGCSSALNGDLGKRK